jgi:hypothetical protein
METTLFISEDCKGATICLKLKPGEVVVVVAAVAAVVAVHAAD